MFLCSLAMYRTYLPKRSEVFDPDLGPVVILYPGSESMLIPDPDPVQSKWHTKRQCCGAETLIPDPYFSSSRIPDPTKKAEVKLI